MKKILTVSASVIAVLAMMLPLLISCGSPEGPSGETTPAPAATSGTPEETKNLYDPNGYLLDDLPGDLNYGGNTVRILYWSDTERPEFEIKEEQLNGSIVEEAIYNRNVNTEERLGVSFEWIGKAGNNSNIPNFVSFVEAQYNGGEFFDIIASYSRTVGTLMCRGFMQDLNAIENSHINYEKPWWPKTLLTTCDIHGHLFAVSGDISTNVLHFMYAIYYNTNLIDEMHIDDPVQFVDNKTWTVDKLIELTSNAYADLDNDGKRSEGDRYGFGSIYFHLDAFYSGSGLRLLETDPDELIVISEDFGSQKAIDLADKLGAWCVSENCYISSYNTAKTYQAPFVKGNELFCQNRVYMADQANWCKLHDVEWTYGILPTPLYDTNQEEYITIVGNPFTLWGIEKGISAEDSSRATAVIECLASCGYRGTTPALFETNMKYRYTTDEKGDSVRMFDIIHDTIDFDLGRIFAYQNSEMSEMPSIAASDGMSWGAQAQIKIKALKKQIANDLTGPLREVIG